MTEVKNRVFFLGAGFSKAIDSRYPVLNELSAKIASQIQCGKSSLSCHYDNELASILKDDIENLLTYLSADWPWKSPKQSYVDKALYMEITEILSKNFIDLSKNDFKNTKYVDTGVLAELEKFILKNSTNVNFITLNYDMIIERCFWDVFSNAFTLDQFYRYPIMEIGAREFNPYIHNNDDHTFEKIPAIIKLHGSANWFWEDVSASDQIYYTEGNEGKEKQALLSGLTPYIVPPVLDKSAFYKHNAIRYLWGQAFKLLRNADEIYIIGFSFPQTDISVKHLFQAALKHSKAKIYVINKAEKNDLEKNYGLVFNQHGNINYDYCGSSDALKNFVIQRLAYGDPLWN